MLTGMLTTALISVAFLSAPALCLGNDLAETFNVMDFGAKGDGKTLDTSAIQRAIDKGCVTSGPRSILFPKDHIFLSLPISLSKCSTFSTEFRIEVGATLLAWDNISSWPIGSSGAFLDFVSGVGTVELHLSGGGYINGQGHKWWQALHEKAPLVEKHGRPKLLSLFRATNPSISSVKFQDAPFYNIQIDGTGGRLSDVTCLAPPESPNTDGVVLIGSGHLVRGGRFAVGGGDNIRVLSNDTIVEKTQLGTGHGTAIGSVKEGGYISGVLFNDIDFIGTQFGCRIKSWPGASGIISNVSWTNIRFHFLRSTCLWIDMFYRSGNKTRPTNLRIRDIHFRSITSKGSQSGQKAGVFRCQPSAPCTELILQDVSLENPQIAPWACENTKLTAKQGVSPSVSGTSCA